MPRTRRDPHGSPGLTPKQQRFTQEYLVDLNGSAAAIRAGYARSSARQIACDLLCTPAVIAVIRDAVTKLREANEFSVQAVIDGLQRIAFSDLRSLFDGKGALRRPETWTPDQAAMLESIQIVARQEFGRTVYVHRIKLWDKLKALELLGKHLGLFVDRLHHEGAIDLEPLTPEQAARLSDEDLRAIIAIAKKARGEQA